MAYKEISDNLVVFTAKRTPSALDNNFTPPAAAKPTKVYLNDYGLKGPWKWWDKNQYSLENNLYPETIKTALAGSSAAAIALETLCVYTYGKGVGVFKKAVVDGKEDVQPVLNENHLKFFIGSRINDYLIQAITDYWTFANQFPQLIKSKDGKKFALIRNIDAPFCRLGRQNKDTGLIEEVFISGNWKQYPKGEEIERVPMLDRYEYEQQIQRNAKQIKWMFPAYSYSPGEVYYHKHPWHAALDTGVLDLSPEIPKIRKARFQNAQFIKYHVEIEQIYWQMQLGEKKWAQAETSPEVKDELRRLKNSVYAQIDQHLGGTDNAFKSLYSDKITDPRTGTVTSLITIKKIETDYGDSAAFDPDKMSNTADIFLAFGIPAPIMNTVLSDNKSRGGGSDIREGILAFQQRLKWHRDNILAPLDFMMRYNNDLAPDEFLAFEDIIPTTLDANPTGVQKTVAA